MLDLNKMNGYKLSYFCDGRDRGLWCCYLSCQEASERGLEERALRPGQDGDDDKARHGDDDGDADHNEQDLLRSKHGASVLLSFVFVSHRSIHLDST